MSHLIKPLKLGELQLTNNLIQAPLAGISSAPFRLLVSELGKPGLCYTEMISVKTVIHTRKLDKRYLWQHPNEGLLGYQLSSNNPDELATATKIITDLGAATIDLNCGCPKPKIRRKGAGSAHLDDPLKLSKLISAMRSSTHLPISIKMRVDGDSHDNKTLEVVKAAGQSGIDFICVHGRHWRDDYEVPCRVDQIQEICDVATVPIIANGDVNSIASLNHLITSTHCHGVMVGRGSIGRPWLFRELQEQNYPGPTLAEIKSIFLRHITMLTELDGEARAIMQARRLGRHYLRHKQDRVAITTALNNIHTLPSLTLWLDSISES